MQVAMETGAASFFLGLLFLCLLFLFCCIAVLGIKSVYILVKTRFLASSEPQPEQSKPEGEPTAKRVRRKVRSIEIDPEEINRISVKRS